MNAPQPEQRSIRITRGQIGQTGLLIGGTSMIGLVLALLWQGVSTLTITLLATTITGLATWALALPREFRSLLTGRQARQSTLAILSTLILLAIVVATYVIVLRANIIADMTVDERFTLSEQSQSILRAAALSNREIEIRAFYTPQNIDQREIDDQYFQLYEAGSDGRVRIRYVDPQAEPGLAAPYTDALAQGIYVFMGYVNDDGNLTSVLPVAMSGRQEEDISQALAILLASGQFTVYFERSLETLDPLNTQQQGMSTIRRLMEQNGIIVQPLELAVLATSNEQIPRNAAALVIARPRRQLETAEIAILANYLQRGGALFIAGDAFLSDDLFMGNDSAFNEFMWENYGLRLTEAIIVDPASSGETQLDILSAQVFTNNAIGANLNLPEQPDTGVVFHIARAIEVDDTPPVQNGRVIMSSPSAWGERNWTRLFQQNDYSFEEDIDVAGPLTSLAWAFDEDTGAKIVLVGDGEFLTNGRVQSPQGNSIVFMDSIGWMTGFTEEVRFEPRGFTTTPLLFVGGQQLDVIAFITLILMPGTMLVISTGIWLRRMRT